jgi:glutamate synthase domain-containing protein 3
MAKLSAHAPAGAEHRESLRGRSQQVFFPATQDENSTYPDALEVDFGRRAAFDAAELSAQAINARIRALMTEGYGHIVVRNPMARHGVGVGILNRLRLDFEGSLGYFGCGLLDGPVVHVSGRVGWSCGENMMAGVVVIEKNAGSTFGAAIRGGDLVCEGDVGARVGIDQKGGTIIVGGRAGSFCGFMMQRGRMIILGDAGGNLGDSMYDGTIYVGGKIASLGVDAVPGELTRVEIGWLERKLQTYGMTAPNGVENLTKIVAGRQLWNYDTLEPAEKKIAL